MNYFPLIVTVHLFGIVLWVGGLWAASRLMLLQLDSREPAGRLPEASLRLFRSTAGHGMMLTLLAGIALVALRPAYYLHRGWFHAKLTLVVAAAALHFVLRKQAARLDSEPGLVSRPLVSNAALGLVAAVAGAFYLVFTQAF